MRKKPFLRDYSESNLPLLEIIQTHQKGLKDARMRNDQEDILHFVGPLGEAYRKLGRLAEAFSYLEEAVSLARALERPRALLSNLLRLAMALQYANRHEEAEDVFQEARQKSEQQGFLQDHIALAYGKHLMESQQGKQALEQIEYACALRRKPGREELLLEAEDTLQAARQTLEAYPRT
jgi:tetratricopeptide (TPR) repeat protein